MSEGLVALALRLDLRLAVDVFLPSRDERR
jgi:hypothetical protein